MTETQAVPHRSAMAAECTWDLTPVYASDAAWEAAIGDLEEMMPRAAALQGRVVESADALQQTLELRDEIQQHLWQIYVYANRRLDADTGDSSGQALGDRAGSLVAKIGAALAFVDPEILGAPETTLRAWVAATPGLAVYGYALDQLIAQRAHVRSAEIEAILAQFGDVTRAPSDTYDTLTNADLTFPEIDDEDGNKIAMSHGRFYRFLRSGDRRARRDSFFAYYSSYNSHRNTLGVTLAAEVRNHALNARLRSYGSALEAALAPNDIPTEVYHNLIDGINAGQEVSYRYTALRKKIMGLDELHVYDLYAPLTDEADMQVTYDKAQEMMLAAFAPLGSEYCEVVARSFRSRWIDVYENQGKRSGAYSDGSYTTAPFILLNYQDKMDDAFTLAHELGHSMHSFFTRKSQPFVYGNYTIFVAEVASTLNEALLADYLLKTTEDKAVRRQILVRQIDAIRLTMYRQTMFAEFERDIHARAEADEPITADGLSQMYRALLARYHGPDVVLDDCMAIEWSRIPHFYYNFYVYQYATGLAASLALFEQITSEGQPAIDRYLKFLSGGSSKSSIELLRDAGVDMLTPRPVERALARFAKLLDELEALG